MFVNTDALLWMECWSPDPHCLNLQPPEQCERNVYGLSHPVCSILLWHPSQDILKPRGKNKPLISSIGDSLQCNFSETQRLATCLPIMNKNSLNFCNSLNATSVGLWSKWPWSHTAQTPAPQVQLHEKSSRELVRKIRILPTTLSLPHCWDSPSLCFHRLPRAMIGRTTDR